MELVKVIFDFAVVAIQMSVLLFIHPVSQPIKEKWRHTHILQHVDIEDDNIGLWEVGLLRFVENTLSEVVKCKEALFYNTITIMSVINIINILLKFV